MAVQTFNVGDRVRVLSGGDGEVTYGPVNSTFDTYKLFVVKQDGDEERAFKASDLEPLPTFAVGDKAKMDGESDPVAIIGGPFTNRYHKWFVVRAEVGDTTASESDLTALPAPAPIVVGDRVRVTEDDPYARTGEFVGMLGTVRRLNHPLRLPYNVEFDADQGAPYTRWNVTSVEKISDESVRVPVGTRVRIDRAKWAEQTHGMTGVVESNTETWRAEDDDTHPYIVRIDNGSGPHVAELTPVDEPADTFEHYGITYDLSVKYRDRESNVWRFARVDGVVRGDWGLHRRSISAEDSTLSYAVDHYGPLTKLTD
ncbi:phiSA1p31-related protein [Streptomyces scopuliridis]